ncbi:alpha-D-ribose 1-methylphosphonate 5-triphosphate diphosphatase [Albimonas sp. CAU 1670]|uniref:alpha-D-ribose 1-methylphosphonate 5-triphosphate diphosphatase n=1 Tax=Albimonas sp. CAU 1670 TaxID=3032599 RepID=UPI0023DC98BC|nr:alpha-D-ribose 1-methylphosphonate 5-triphosphate diphosphatase [Albimonas sp. CAU 1670]MDF2232727.1 alpha-D-ribose 1-methylphosphonate 5-triphosphate diphosphatase [Albimonas sp. CAU 1670]
MTAYLISGATALLPEGPVETCLRVEDGRIVEIGDPPAAGALRVDGRGLWLAPALVDIHGDAFERAVMPRPGVFMPGEVAAMDVDRQLAALGIATAYHALTLSWEPGLRSVERGEAFLDALAAAGPRLGVDHRIQIRWETFALEALPVIERALAAGPTPAIAFNDHTSMTMRDRSVPVTERAFEHGPDFVEAPPGDPQVRRSIRSVAARAGLDEDGYAELLAAVWARRPQVPDAIARVAAAGRAAGAPMLSHDDSQHETRAFFRAHGARIAEFPMSEAVAREARAAGEHVVLGAPNALRGGSHIGSLSAADMIEDGVCDILASDYHYPALPAAMGRLAAERRGDRATLWACVSANPAAALGLSDRGRIAPGLRADLVLLDWPEGGVPSARLTLAAGRPAHLAGDLIRAG